MRPTSSIGGDQISDEALVSRARAGDGAAFAELFERYQDRVYQMSLRMLRHREDALDVSQEIFLAVHRSLATFEDKARFSTWLYRITVNRCRDELRRRATVKHTRPRSLHATGPEGESMEPASAEAGPVDRIVARELQEEIEEAIAALPDELREILLLRDIEGLSYEEVAAVLEVPVGTVRSRLHRARAQLAESIRPRVRKGEA